MKINLILAASIFLTGCASFSTKQTDESYDIKTQEKRTITTYVTAHTLFSSRSELAKFKASQTDKTQSTAVGALSQTSDGTNAVQILEALAKIVGALPK